LNGIERLDHHVVVGAQKCGRVGSDSRRIQAVARLGRIANEGALNVKSEAGVHRRARIRGEARNRLADLAETKDTDPDGSDLGSRGRLSGANA
jgi:hypothetical protein